MLGLIHAFGAGTDASAVWFRWWVILTAPLIGGLFVYRVFSAGATKHDARRRTPQERQSHRDSPARAAPDANPITEEA